MSKADELKKEAEEYANNILKDVTCNIGHPRARHINSIDVEEAYLAGAEPREKRITELEKENAELKQINSETLAQLNLDNGELILEIDKLQKENAELKELKKKKEEIDIMTNFCKTCKQIHTDQLAQAKELLKKLLHALKNEGSDYTFALESTHPILVQAEQFLKEIEK